MREVSGYRGSTGRTWRLAQEANVRAGINAYRDRHSRKREYRALWVTRLTAACKMRGIQYSRFIFGLAQAKIELNRKMLSEIAIHSPADFDALVAVAKKHVPKQSAAA
jgi:large subunit ribosomal protein L20